jgi:small-conductance mechanosensitive channel
MQIKNWHNLQIAWKQEKKPNIDIHILRAEVKKRESLKRFRVILETVIILSIIGFTINRLITQPDFLGYLILGQLWFITILALTFNVWNRFSLNIDETYSHMRYLKLLFDHSIRKRKTAIFVFSLTILNLSFYIVLILTGYISFSTDAIIKITGLLIIYTVWSAWYYQAASSNIKHYQEKLRKITDR